LIEENGGRRHAAPTPSELGSGQEEEDILILSFMDVVKRD
jgi:hypothetical protein